MFVDDADTDSRFMKAGNVVVACEAVRGLHAPAAWSKKKKKEKKDADRTTHGGVETPRSSVSETPREMPPPGPKLSALESAELRALQSKESGLGAKAKQQTAETKAYEPNEPTGLNVGALARELYGGADGNGNKPRASALTESAPASPRE